LPSDRFVFEGFLPRRGSARRERIGAVADETRTVVLFCSPARLSSDLTDLAAASPGGRPCVVVREMTKLHEEVWRGDLAGAAAHWSATDVRGEVTVVIGPAPVGEPSLDDAVARVGALVEAGLTRSEAVRRVSAERGVSRRLLYEATLGDEDG
jgi:16S rRNA (cytidine1402-2'-O)-methyltransferase